MYFLCHKYTICLRKLRILEINMSNYRKMQYTFTIFLCRKEKYVCFLPTKRFALAKYGKHGQPCIQMKFIDLKTYKYTTYFIGYVTYHAVIVSIFA